MSAPPSGAVLSPDGRYRYTLWRRWSAAPPLALVMLNPSTADAHLSDATTTTCIRFAQRDGYGGIVLRNLFAYRTASPAILVRESRTADVVGPENDEWLDDLLQDPEQFPRIVLAWGRNGTRPQFMGRARDVTMRFYKHAPERVFRFDPRPVRGPAPHPLYLPKDTRIVPYIAPR